MRDKILKIIFRIPSVKAFIQRGLIIKNRIFNRKRSIHIKTKKIYDIILKDHETFFGYYDYSPVNLNGKYLIFYSTNYPTWKKPSVNHPINIVLKNLKTNKTDVIDVTTSYNWQQGSRLQWVNEEEFIYNIYDQKDKSFKSKLFNIYTRSFQVFKLPIQSGFKKIFFIG